MPLSASLVVLIPTLTVNAQDASIHPTTHVPASKILEQQPKSKTIPDTNFSKPQDQQNQKLSAAPVEVNLREIRSPEAKLAPISGRASRLLQGQRTNFLEPAAEQSAPAIASAPVNPLDDIGTQTKPSSKPEHKPAIAKPIAKLPVSKTAIPTKAIVNPLDDIPGVNKPAIAKPTATKPTNRVATTAPKTTLPKLPAPLTASTQKAASVIPTTTVPATTKPTLAKVAVPVNPAIAKSNPTNVTVKPNTNVAAVSPSTSPATNNSTPTSAPVTSVNSTNKVAIGLDPRQPLVVPTTPSQVKIERTQPLSLKEALELSDRTNPTISQARIALERAKAVLDEAVAGRNPTVTANSSYNYGNSSFFVGTRSPTSHTLNSGVTLNYDLYTSGRVDANIRAAENSLRSAEADLSRISQTTRLNIATAYYDAQNADGQVRIRDQQVKNAERSLQDSQALERAGVGTKFDVLQSQVQLANAQQTLSNARAQQTITRRQLARQLSYPSNLSLFPSDEVKPNEDWKLGLEETILLAYKNRAELDIAKLQRQIAVDRAAASLANLGPQLNIFARLDHADQLNRAGDLTLGYTLGATLNWSIFDGGIANARAKQSEADRALAESQFTEGGNQARFDVESAYNNLRARQEQIESTTLAVQQATEALRLSRLRLSAGVGTQLEVLRSEDALIEADVNRLDAIIGFNLSLVQLQRAINGL